MFAEVSKHDFDLAITQAGLNQLIESFPEKENYFLSNNGENLSGGEKQRIVLARALIAKTPILLLDEPFSALDSITSRKIFDTIFSISELTVVFVTHGFNLIQGADKIIMLHDNTFYEVGTFSELINNHKMFYSLFTFYNYNEELKDDHRDNS